LKLKGVVAETDELFGISNPTKILKDLLLYIKKLLLQHNDAARLIRELNYVVFVPGLKELYKKLCNEEWTDPTRGGDIKREIFVTRVVNLFLVHAKKS
jgi:hypothetical protein